MKKTALVILAAGIGSRFGGGIKQLESVGPNGEIIMDYSIHDALEAGFNKVVFIIRKDIEEDFKRIIGNRIEKITEVAYAFQEITDLPNGFSVPTGRVKPWGTGHALLACREILKEPFVVINADDYYGKEGFQKIHAYLTSEESSKDILDMCMAGFVLGNTLSENGGVTRGICQMNQEGFLTDVCETANIIKTEQGAAVLRDKEILPVDANSLVSMNMWGLTPEFLQVLEDGFPYFLQEKADDLKSEYLLPMIINQLIHEKKARVRVLKTVDSWFGVTYQEDKQGVIRAINKLITDGVYTARLFD